VKYQIGSYREIPSLKLEAFS